MVTVTNMIVSSSSYDNITIVWPAYVVTVISAGGARTQPEWPRMARNGFELCRNGPEWLAEIPELAGMARNGAEWRTGGAEGKTGGAEWRTGGTEWRMRLKTMGSTVGLNKNSDRSTMVNVT